MFNMLVYVTKINILKKGFNFMNSHTFVDKSQIWPNNTSNVLKFQFFTIILNLWNILLDWLYFTT